MRNMLFMSFYSYFSLFYQKESKIINMQNIIFDYYLIFFYKCHYIFYYFLFQFRKYLFLFLFLFFLNYFFFYIFFYKIFFFYYIFINNSLSFFRYFITMVQFEYISLGRGWLDFFHFFFITYCYNSTIYFKDLWLNSPNWDLDLSVNTDNEDLLVFLFDLFEFFEQERFFFLDALFDLWYIHYFYIFFFFFELYVILNLKKQVLSIFLAKIFWI